MSSGSLHIAVSFQDLHSRHQKNRAVRLARELNLPLVSTSAHRADADLVLLVSGAGLSLSLIQGDKELVQGKPVHPDWTFLDTQSPVGRKRQQPLWQAVRGRRKYNFLPVILDGTAGLGEDTWLLASLGHGVIAVEKNPVVFALFRDAWSRAGITRPDVATRIRPICNDIHQVLLQLNKYAKHGRYRAEGLLPRPHIIYLDPMYSHIQSRKTAEKKQMRILRLIVGIEENDEHLLLKTALEVARNRVVVKRSLHAPLYASGLIKPVRQVKGRSVRYDVYVA